MKKIIVSLYDIVSETYEGLFDFQNIAVAKRYFDNVKDKVPFWTDKIAYVIGTFDPGNGNVLSCEHYPLFDEVDSDE